MSATPTPTVMDHFRMDGQVPLVQVVEVSRFVDIVETPVQSGQISVLEFQEFPLMAGSNHPVLGGRLSAR